MSGSGRFVHMFESPWVAELHAAAARVVDVARAAPDVAALAGPDLDGALQGLDAMGERVAALRLRLLSEQQRSGSWRGRGDRSHEAWRGRTTGSGEQVARAESRLADAAESVPAARVALEAGEIT